jgi:hypothetical protein
MSLEQALINSGNAENAHEAIELISYMRERFNDGEDPEEILYEYGLEPDYVIDLWEV